MSESPTFVPGETPDAKQAMLDALRELFPAAFPDGVLDTQALLSELGESERKPGFVFSWPGIDQARVAAQSPTTATLEPDVQASVGFDEARDVLIEGDNLQVLKILKNGYEGAVKLIYIDPPYNTGESFTYNDNFAAPEAEYLRDTLQVDEQGNALTSRIDTSGRKHAPWLSMMFPRLAVARHLLRRDGAIFVSIDNNEVHHLRVLLDAVFGADNFVDMMTWRGARKGDAKLTGGGQDYILIYARDKAWLKSNDIRWRERKDGLEAIYDKVAELRELHGDDYVAASKAMRDWYKALPDESPSKAHAHYRLIDDVGVFYPGDISSPNPRENLRYDWLGYAQPANGWRYEKSRMQKMHDEGRLIYPDSKDKRIQFKGYLHEHEDWAPVSVFYRDRRSASKNLDALMDGKVFDDPKTPDVLSRLFDAVTDDNDIILDFFAGSGSTGQAVWEQNQKDGKIRHWVLVQAPERPDPSEPSGKKALELGYKTIFEITAERLRRNAKTLAPKGAPIGFRVFRARETQLVVDAPIRASAELDGQAYFELVLQRASGSPVAEGTNPISVAWEVALKATSTRLDSQVLAHEVNGVTVYEFIDHVESEGRLLVALDEFTLEAAEALGLSDTDVLILRGDKVSDSVTLTLAPRLQSKLILLERVPREVSL